MFDVNLEGIKVLNNYDIIKKAGALTATTETFPVTVKDGVLNLDFSALPADGGVDQAKVSAIEVYPATSSSSDRKLATSDTPILTTKQPLLLQTAVIKKEIADQQLSFGLNISPVPTNTFFNITLTGTDYIDKVTLKVFDDVGRIIQIKKELLVGQILQIGNTYNTVCI